MGISTADSVHNTVEVLVRSVRCVSVARQVIIWGSALVALGAWVGMLVLSDDLGPAAGGDGGFVMFVSVAITATLSSVVSIVLPDSQRIYALGVERGLSMQVEQERVRHLTAVR